MKKSKLFILIFLFLCMVTGCKKEKPKNCKHVESDWIIDIDSTCTKNGTKHTECTKCGIKINQEQIEKADHSIIHHEGKDATCTESGYKAYDLCKNCDYTTYQKISSLGHNYINDVCNRCYIPSPTNYQYKLSIDKTYYIYTGLSNVNNVLNIIIPSEYNGLPVEGIAVDAFENCENVINIEIPSTIKYFEQTIDNDSTTLLKCTKLIYNEYDNGYYLGNKENPYLILVKAKNTNISEIKINNNSHCISALAFKNCKKLLNVDVPNSITSIGIGAFSGCSSLVSMSLPFVGSKLNEIVNTHFGYIFGAESHKNNSSYVPTTLKEVIVGGKSIGSFAFENCSLINIKVLDSVTSIKEFAFCNCKYLKEIKLSNNITSINGGVFRYCSNLKSIELPSNIISIEGIAFEDCFSLTSVIIPKKVINISWSAFMGCSNLESIQYHKVL